MVLFKSRDAYFAHVAKQHNTTPEVVEAVAYGEKFVEDKLVTRLFKEFVNHPEFMYVAIVWEGSAFPGTIRNLQNYEYTGQVMEGLNLHLHRTPYTVQIFPTNNTIGDVDYFRRLLSKRPNSGIVILATETADNLLQACREQNRPYLFLHHPAEMDMSEHYLISVRTEGMMRQVVSHLYDLGHRSIAFIRGTPLLNAGKERLNDYSDAMQSVGLAVEERLIVGGNWQEHGGYQAGMTLLELDAIPTAIIASNDRMAIGAMGAIREQGLRIPDDISIVGYDDIAAAIQVRPMLSTVRQPMTRIGAKAAEYIVTLLEGGTPQPRHDYLPVELILRDSTGAPPSMQ